MKLAFALLPYPQEYKRKYAMELASGEKQQLASIEMERRTAQLSRDVASLLLTVENTLVIIFRHLEFYFTQAANSIGRMSKGSMQSSLSGADSQSIGTDADALHRLSHDTNAQLGPELHRIEMLELSKDLLGPKFKSRANFLLMVIRRITDLVSLGVPEEFQAGGGVAAMDGDSHMTIY